MGIEIRKVVVEGWGGSKGGRRQNGKGDKGIFQGDSNVLIFDWGIVYTFFKIYRIVYLRFVQFIVCNYILKKKD